MRFRLLLLHLATELVAEERAFAVWLLSHLPQKRSKAANTTTACTVVSSLLVEPEIGLAFPCFKPPHAWLEVKLSLSRAAPQGATTFSPCPLRLLSDLEDAQNVPGGSSPVSYGACQSSLEWLDLFMGQSFYIPPTLSIARLPSGVSSLPTIGRNILCSCLDRCPCADGSRIRPVPGSSGMYGHLVSTREVGSMASYQTVNVCLGRVQHSNPEHSIHKAR